MSGAVKTTSGGGAKVSALLSNGSQARRKSQNHRSHAALRNYKFDKVPDIHELVVTELGSYSRPPSLGWTTSGFWKGEELLLLDAAFERLAMVEPSGLVSTASQTFRYENGDPIDLVRPSYVVPRAGGGLVLLDLEGSESSSLYFIKESGLVEKRVRTQGASLALASGGEIQLNGVFRMTSLDVGTIAVLADYQIDNRYFTGFIRINPFSGKNEIIGQPVPDYLQEYYVRDLAYLASVQGEVFFLSTLNGLSENPTAAIMRVGVESTESEVHLELSSISPLPILDRTKEFYGSPARVEKWISSLYEALESRESVVGLYSWDRKLWLLFKSGSKRRELPRWYFAEIGADGRLGGRTEIPIRAAHVTLVPSSDRVAVVGKGPIRTLGTRSRGVLYRSTTEILEISW